MTATEIARASDIVLAVRENELQDIAATTSSEEAHDAAWEEIDSIREEQAKRRWALEDPSSGLGLHQPT